MFFFFVFFRKKKLHLLFEVNPRILPDLLWKFQNIFVRYTSGNPGFFLNLCDTPSPLPLELHWYFTRLPRIFIDVLNKGVKNLNYKIKKKQNINLRYSVEHMSEEQLSGIQ